MQARPQAGPCVRDCAASTPVIAVTAWQALFEKAKVERGETVVIHGSAGGVGAFAVQLANAAGIKVIGTAKASDIPFVMTLGAEEAIDYRSERFESRAQNVDAVIDLVGGETQVRSFKILRPGGRLISSVSPPDPALAEQRGMEAHFFLVEVTTARLERDRRHARIGDAFGGYRRRSAVSPMRGHRPRDARRNSPEAALQARAQAPVRSNQSAIGHGSGCLDCIAAASPQADCLLQAKSGLVVNSRFAANNDAVYRTEHPKTLL